MGLRGFNRKFYMSAKTYEGTWGTAEAEADLCPFRVDSDPFEVAPEFQDDTDLIGGSEEPTSQQELARVVTGTISQPRVQPHLLAAIASFSMASSVSSSLVDTSAYRHVIEPNTSDFLLKSFTALDLYTAAYYEEHIGCMVNSFTLSTGRKGWLSLSADILGSGKTVQSGLTVGSLGSEVSEVYLKAGDAYIWLGESPSENLPGTWQQHAEDLVGTPTAVRTKFGDFSWKYNNNPAQDSLYEPGSGIYMGRAERDKRSQTLSFSVEIEDLTYLDYLTGQTELQMEFDFMSGVLAGDASIYYGAQIIFPSLKLISCKPTGGTGKLIAECEAKVMENDESTPDPTVEVVVWNKQATYLTT